MGFCTRSNSLQLIIFRQKEQISFLFEHKMMDLSNDSIYIVMSICIYYNSMLEL